MKKYLILTLVFISALFGGCKKTTPTETFDITGSWELVKVETKAASVGGQTVSVYVSFGKDGTFALYQQLGEGSFKSFNGTYSYTSGRLSGKYADGNSLGSDYAVEGSADTMTLTTSTGAEVDTYSRISSIPDSVISGVLQ